MYVCFVNQSRSMPDKTLLKSKCTINGLEASIAIVYHHANPLCQFIFLVIGDLDFAICRPCLVWCHALTIRLLHVPVWKRGSMHQFMENAFVPPKQLCISIKISCTSTKTCLVTVCKWRSKEIYICPSSIRICKYINEKKKKTVKGVSEHVLSHANFTEFVSIGLFTTLFFYNVHIV